MLNLSPQQSRIRAAILTAVCASMLAAANCSNSPTAPTAPALKVTSISPAMGSTTGGTAVTVTGSEFGTDTTVTVAGVPATKVTLQGTTSLTATIGATPTAGASDVVVSSAGKSATLARGFTFFAPTGNNLPPTISSVRSVGPRANQPSGFANIGDSMTLIPSISNAESGATLAYEWTGEGTFTPTTDGTTSWRVPDGVSPAPKAITATLGIIETFAEGAVTHMQMGVPFGFVMQVHDSKKEVLDMGEDFLTRFTQQLPVDTVLHNFSPTCDRGDGRSGEAFDVEKNQREVIEDVAAFRISRREPFILNFRSTCFTSDGRPQNNVDACSSFGVHWEGQDKTRGNARFVVNGIDYVSAVVENNQWRLCHSSFVGTENFPTLGITRSIAW